LAAGKGSEREDCDANKKPPPPPKKTPKKKKTGYAAKRKGRGAGYKRRVTIPENLVEQTVHHETGCYLPAYKC